jgi:hypothetical protein
MFVIREDRYSYRCNYAALTPGGGMPYLGGIMPRGMMPVGGTIAGEIMSIHLHTK